VIEDVGRGWRVLRKRRRCRAGRCRTRAPRPPPTSNSPRFGVPCVV